MILVMDGQGGKVGRALVEGILKTMPQADLFAVGTNTAATANMLRGGAARAATGENAVIVACRRAEAIVGPMGIAMADSLGGEVTPAMALAVSQSEAVRVLIPFFTCDTLIAGVSPMPLSALIDDAIAKLAEVIGKEA